MPAKGMLIQKRETFHKVYKMMIEEGYMARTRVKELLGLNNTTNMTTTLDNFDSIGLYLYEDEMIIDGKVVNVVVPFVTTRYAKESSQDIKPAVNGGIEW